MLDQGNAVTATAFAENTAYLGIYESNTYTVIDTKYITQGPWDLQLLKVRQTINANVFSGEYNDDSSSWTNWLKNQV